MGFKGAPVPQSMSDPKSIHQPVAMLCRLARSTNRSLCIERPTWGNRGHQKIDQPVSLMFPIDGFQIGEKASFFQARNGIGQFHASHEIERAGEFEAGNDHVSYLEIRVSLVGKA